MPRASLTNQRAQTWSGPPATKAQINFLEILFNDCYPEQSRKWRLHWVEARIDRWVNALDELSLREATRLISDLKSTKEENK